MDRLNDSEIEKARCYAFSVLDERTKKYGRQPKGTVESIFCQKVAEMLGIENQSLSEYIREYQRNTLKAHISILRPLACISLSECLKRQFGAVSAPERANNPQRVRHFRGLTKKTSCRMNPDICRRPESRRHTLYFAPRSIFWPCVGISSHLK